MTDRDPDLVMRVGRAAYDAVIQAERVYATVGAVRCEAGTAVLDILAAEGRLCEPQMGVVIPDQGGSIRPMPDPCDAAQRKAFVAGCAFADDCDMDAAEAEALRRWPA